MKIIRETHSVSGTTELGWPDQSVQFLGTLLLIFTLIYAYPRTSVLGAILLTGYLGGATATMIRAGQPLYFSVIFGIMVWVGLFLNNQTLRSLIPLTDSPAVK
jgi:TRAP-type C4-dicarboxylate transport system permease small subunit